MTDLNGKSFFYTLLLLALIHFGASSSVAIASDSQVFIDGSTLYGVSDQSIFKSDLRSGEVTITYSDGTVVNSWIKISRRTMTQIAARGEIIWINAEILEDDFTLMSTNCEGEANSLIKAIEAVQAACAGSGQGSASCTSAQSHLQQAWAAYDACLSQN